MSIYYDTFILHLIQDIDYIFVRKQNISNLLTYETNLKG